MSGHFTINVPYFQLPPGLNLGDTIELRATLRITGGSTSPHEPRLDGRTYETRALAAEVTPLTKFFPQHPALY